jgi:hypothetical protein
MNVTKTVMHPVKDKPVRQCRLFAAGMSAAEASGHGILASGATGLPCPMNEIAWI